MTVAWAEMMRGGCKMGVGGSDVVAGGEPVLKLALLNIATR